MSSDYAWSAPVGPTLVDPVADREVPRDIASVADLWVSTAYDDLRRAGPDRAEQIRWMLDRYVIPWFGPQTSSVGEITYFMVHAWLLRLVGREHPGDEELPLLLDRDEPDAGRDLSLREAARSGGVSLATARRRWRDGELPGAYRDTTGHIRVTERAAATMSTSKRPAGLSQSVIADALWVLRGVLGFARATGIVQPGFNPTEGLVPPAPDPATARARLPESMPRPLTLAECARIAGHLHPVHQTALWLQRVMGLRISEAFGLLVDDVIDHGDSGVLLVRGQGGRDFLVRDDHGRVITVPRKERTKTAAATRALVIPDRMLDLLRVAIEAFHVDPETGDAEAISRLVPGIRVPDEAGQLGFRMAFEAAAQAEGLGSSDLGFHVTPHLLRKSVATDIAWYPGIEDPVRRRFMGHRAADDVYGRVYTLDHPDLVPLAKVARALDELIAGSIGTLMVPTTRRARWARTHPIRQRAVYVQATLDAAGWTVEPGRVDDPLCDTHRVAAELGIAATTARRWMHEGQLRCETTTGDDGVPRRLARLSEVWSLRDRRASRILLPELAIELGVRYHELYQTARRLGLELQPQPTGRQFDITHEAAQHLRAEVARIQALHARSMKIAVAAQELDLAVSTIGRMVNRGELTLDPESDSSLARFVTRASVERVLIARRDASPGDQGEDVAVPLDEVIRFTGRGRTELLDLVRAGALQQLPGRGSCQLTASSLRTWVAAAK